MLLQQIHSPITDKPLLSEEEAKAADQRFEEGVEPAPIPVPEESAGFFDGIGEAAWKGAASGFLKSGSVYSTMVGASGLPEAAESMAMAETGQEALVDADTIRDRIEQDAINMRERARKDYGVNPETMGTAAQIVYGLSEMLPKAMAYTIAAGPTGGAVAFGFDYGASRAQELMDEGVDTKTAVAAGIWTGAAGALGVKIPATFGSSRLASAAIGAAANAGLTVAEEAGVQFALESQNYDQLAEQYGLNFVDIAASAFFGGAMGGVLYRPRTGTATERTITSETRAKIEDDIFNKLMATGRFNEEQARVQAKIHFGGMATLASRAGVDVEKIAPTITFTDELAGSSFDQIIGPHGARNIDVAGDNLRIAESMEAAGKNMSEIWRATGWERGVDGQWRYEIPDIQFKENGFRVILEADKARNAEQEELYKRSDLSDDEVLNMDKNIADKYENKVLKTTLDEIVEAPELFDAYPQLRSMRVEFGKLPNQVLGYYSPVDNLIRVDRRANIVLAETRTVLAHEIQHAIQEIEGFALGGNPNAFSSAGQTLYRDMAELRRLRQAPQWQEYAKAQNDYLDAAINEADPDTIASLRERVDALANNEVVSAFKQERERLINQWGISEKILRAINNDFAADDPIWVSISEDNPFFKQQQYRRVAGEVESRNVQTRLGMGENSRAETPLSATEDIPRNDQIITHLGNLSSQDIGDMRLDTLSDAVAKVERIVDRFLSGQSTNGYGRDSYADYLPVSERLTNDLKKLGIDVDGYTHSVLDSDIAHAYARHGQGKETFNNQVSLTKNDFLRLPLVVEQYDSVELSGVTRRTRAQTVIYTKTFSDGTQYVVEEIRKGRKKLTFRTAYKKIPSVPDTSEEPSPPALRLTRAEAASPVNFSIADIQRNVNNFVPEQPLINRAIDTFGVTNDVREAFYVLPDGTMLDGSGRHWGGDEVNVAGTRQVDHGDIGEIIDDANSAADAMYKFMARTGAMRFDQIVGIASVAQTPTPQQLRVLSQASKGKYLALSRNTPEGRIVDDIEFDRASAKKIEDFFNQAETKFRQGVQGAFAQREQGQIRGSYDPARNDIRLTQNADISTYSHEMGHWYLYNIFELSKVAGDNTTLREDAQALLKEFGVKSIEDWEALGVDGQRKFHEQFASWVEVYLAEGKAPKPALQRVFERFAQWLVDLYREFGGVREAVGGRYEAEFGEQLPAVSPEVKKVLDRLFLKDNEMRKARSNVTKEQVASARVVQSKRSLDKKLQDIMKMRTAEEKAQAIKELGISLDGVNRATDQINSANTVNLNNLAEQVSVDPEKMKTARGNFAKAYMIGDKGKAVVLQNRDRSSKVSTGQISSIAGNLQYGLVSISRSYNGAPIVSFGDLPPDAQLGNNDFIFETNGRRIPFTYAVVEAADVETSNAMSGASNDNYGNQERMNAVVGNGRMTAIREAYSKGTADNYRQEFTADTDQHGIDAAVIEGMKQPVLVRIINPEDVDDGLINRSNDSQVLKRNSVEVAFEDAGRIRARASVYEFDERGEPTRDTVVQFLQDIGDIQALGDMVTPDGRPTLDATRRIHNAVFYAAYESPELSQLYSMEADPGIKRILNAMAIIAPKIIQLKDVAPHLDFSTNMVEAANRILAARRASEKGVDLINQGALDGMENPLTQQFIDLFNQNMNSSAGIVEVLRPLSDWARNAIDATDGGMFGEDFAVNVDLADLAQQLVDIQNVERNVRGLDPLPDIDKPVLRRLIEQTRQTTDEVNAQLDALAAREAEDAAQGQAQQAVDLARSAEVLNPETSDSARLAFAVEQNPDQMFSILDDNGQVVRGTADELFAAIDEEVRQADTEAAATGRAVECILRNNGI